MLPLHPTPTGGDAAIAIDRLTKRYGGLSALAEITLDVPAGEVLGVLGPNGAGKSTLVEILVGLRVASSGHVRVLGLDPARERRRLGARIGVQTQQTSLFARLTVLETLRLFAAVRARSLGAGELLELVGLEEQAATQVRRLSGGQRQRVALAAALAGRPEVLFLDEPTEALDPHARRRLWSVVTAECRRGATVVLTTHSMEEAQAVCDRVAIVDRGRLVAVGSPAALIARHAPTPAIVFDAPADLDLADLRGLPTVEDVRVAPGQPRARVRVLTRAPERALPAMLERRGSAVLDGLRLEQGTLEDVFLGLTGRSLEGSGT